MSVLWQCEIKAWFRFEEFWLVDKLLDIKEIDIGKFKIDHFFYQNSEKLHFLYNCIDNKVLKGFRLHKAISLTHINIIIN